MDQAYLEPVIPQVKSLILIINGKYEGQEAILENINISEKKVTVELVNSNSNHSSNKSDKITLNFNDICKYQK